MKKINESLNKVVYINDFEESDPFEKIIGNSKTLKESLYIAKKASKSDSSVIIYGESGTGKELLAEAIHLSSKRKDNPLIKVNCASIPDNLIESELFGHEKGSFTGAVKRKLGKFELAQNGTIFLDEIGEMDKNIQAKILRAIQNREIQRVGGEETIKLNIRIISATNKNLEEMIKKNEFREDLFYRLNVIPIELPPLRDRKGDITLLIKHFFNKKLENNEIRNISDEALMALCNYKWNGNIRELENIIERILVLSEKSLIDIEDIPYFIRKYNNNCNIKLKEITNTEDSLPKIFNDEKIYTLKEYEKLIIEKALKKYGSYNKAGKALGITHRTVSLKAKEYGLEKLILWK
ncbi:sigma-54-dependent Fis family transcriptional regulator [Clostridium baratii]|uniref:sigma-54 interaction domain-containing protein n=1 Tax=Clostridium baratii TaxID=1561 RepID=UPI002431B5B2|nr:sigma-54 dependent transcriptional regulator [Clostridium baratii]MDU4910409.1 sigma-54 dependent transcriptional regulator [Clostridium baratii]